MLCDFDKSQLGYLLSFMRSFYAVFSLSNYVCGGIAEAEGDGLIGEAGFL